MNQRIIWMALLAVAFITQQAGSQGSIIKVGPARVPLLPPKQGLVELMPVYKPATARSTTIQEDRKAFHRNMDRVLPTLEKLPRKDLERMIRSLYRNITLQEKINEGQAEVIRLQDQQLELLMEAVEQTEH